MTPVPIPAEAVREGARRIVDPVRYRVTMTSGDEYVWDGFSVDDFGGSLQVLVCPGGTRLNAAQVLMMDPIDGQ